jgi:hypothetical protein
MKHLKHPETLEAPETLETPETPETRVLSSAVAIIKCFSAV